MNCFLAYKQKQRVDNLFRLASECGANPELQAHYSRYLCVVCSGYVEESVRCIFKDYAAARAPQASGVVTRYLSRFQNPKASLIVDLARLFDSQWAATFETNIDGEIADAINSVVNTRNQIAHGSDVDISLLRMRDYYRAINRAIGMLDQHFC